MLTYPCLTLSPLLALRFCFFTPIFCNMIYISLFTLCFDEIHLIGFYFVTWCFCIISYKNTRGFSPTPTANSRRRAFARNVEFCFIVSGSERTFTIELQYMLKYMLNYIVRADDCVMICWIVGSNLTFDVHEKPDTFTLLHHYTVIMAIAFRIIVNKKKAVTAERQSWLLA